MDAADLVGSIGNGAGVFDIAVPRSAGRNADRLQTSEGRFCGFGAVPTIL